MLEARRKEEEATVALLHASTARKASTSSSSSSESEAERKKDVRKMSASYQQSTYNGDMGERSSGSSRSATPGPPPNEDIYNREASSARRMDLLEVLPHCGDLVLYKDKQVAGYR